MHRLLGHPRRSSPEYRATGRSGTVPSTRAGPAGAPPPLPSPAAAGASAVPNSQPALYDRRDRQEWLSHTGARRPSSRTRWRSGHGVFLGRIGGAAAAPGGVKLALFFRRGEGSALFSTKVWVRFVNKRSDDCAGSKERRSKHPYESSFRRTARLSAQVHRARVWK